MFLKLTENVPAEQDTDSYNISHFTCCHFETSVPVHQTTSSIVTSNKTCQYIYMYMPA